MAAVKQPQFEIIRADNRPFVTYLEGGAERELLQTVERLLPTVIEEREQPGAGTYENCLGTSNVFARLFRDLGVLVFQCGYGMNAATYAEHGGYRLKDGSVLRHHYLAIGSGMRLMDPTAGQSAIADDGPLRLDAYEVDTGERFIDWRARILGG